jgi:hypothetical protein
MRRSRPRIVAASWSSEFGVRLPRLLFMLDKAPLSLAAAVQAQPEVEAARLAGLQAGLRCRAP